MAVYMIFRFDVTDLEKLHAYGSPAFSLLRKHRAEILVIDLEGKTLEGVSPTGSVVVGFASEALAMAFYDDPEYVALRRIRAEATTNSSGILCQEFVQVA